MNKHINTISPSSPFLKTRVTTYENDRLTQDFYDLARKTEPIEDHRFTASTFHYNLAKNRYLDVKPSDHSRVKLSPLPCDQGSDYINASYIDERYISCQAPLSNTIGDFWRMIWENNSTLIVMLTRLSERGCVKAHPYWPEIEGETKAFPGVGLEVQLSKIMKKSGIIIRAITLSKRSTNGSGVLTRRNILQLHYMQWPDHGAPASSEDICRMLDINEQISKETRSGPTVVHCSAGIGRSGTFIAADLLIKRMKALTEHQKKKEEEEEKDELNFEESPCTALRLLKKIVKELRAQRRGMVQTEEQYKFVYQIYKEKMSGRWGRLLNNNINNNIRMEQDEGSREVLDGNKKETHSVDTLMGFATSTSSAASWTKSPLHSPSYSAINVHS